MKNIILASASKRRSEILTSCNIRHKITISNAVELIDLQKTISKIVIANAELKAAAIAKSTKSAIVIGSDTLVTHGKDIIGKPNDEQSAKKMLSKFSGNNIEIYTGLCVIDADSGKKASGFDKSEISVAVLSNREINKIFHLLGPYDKAGGFSIEGVGSMIFDNIKGSYFNILGLPMIKLKELFSELGYDILDYVKHN